MRRGGGPTSWPWGRAPYGAGGKGFFDTRPPIHQPSPIRNGFEHDPGSHFIMFCSYGRAHHARMSRHLSLLDTIKEALAAAERAGLGHHVAIEQAAAVVAADTELSLRASRCLVACLLSPADANALSIMPLVSPPHP